MPLTPGTTLGPYEVLALLGVGGMGEVYRARDTKLGREVAIKVLPEEVARDPERLARFEREARTLAALNHPNIATLHGFEREGETHFLVMELVPGETLADRIARGPIPVAEAIPLFLQIAEGLEAAHERGIVHRDLKPANIKLGADGSSGSVDAGRAKILDFGLAKALGPDDASDPALSSSPTMTLSATRRGEILGTAAYMSPEQAKGHRVDKRADIWAWGACCYEALSGKPVFQGASVAEVMSEVLTREPDWSALDGRVPQHLEQLLRACLVKDARGRLRDIGDARLLLAAGSPLAETPAPQAAAPTRPWLAAATAALALLVGVAVGRWLTPAGPPPASEARPRQLSIVLPEEYPLRLPHLTEPDRAAVVSPDGEWLVYVAAIGPDPLDRVLVKRRLDGREFTVIPGTRGAHTPFFSPDSEWLGFGSLSDNKIKKVRLTEGSPVDVCSVNLDYVVGGATWGRDDRIYFSKFVGPSGIYSVPASGGEPRLMEAFQQGQGRGFRAYPAWAGPHLLYMSGTGPEIEQIEVHALDPASGESVELLRGAGFPHFVESGRLLVVTTARGLVAVAFDAERGRIEGSQVNVTPPGTATTLFPWSLSADGTLVFADAELRRGAQTAVWVDRDGGREALGFPALPISDWPALAPGRDRLVQGSLNSRGEGGLSVFDLETGREQPLDVGRSVVSSAVWTPDGGDLVFTSFASGEGSNLYRIAADGRSRAEQLTTGASNQRAYAVSQNGRTLFFTTDDGSSLEDIMALDLEDPEHPVERLLATERHETAPALSPDGRWLAYMEGPDAGQLEIMVRPFPELDVAYWVPIEPGAHGRMSWSADGNELFFVRPEGIMSVRVARGPSLTVSAPRLVVPGRFHNYPGVVVAGDRFLVSEHVPETVQELRVVLHWDRELERLVPRR